MPPGFGGPHLEQMQVLRHRNLRVVFICDARIKPACRAEMMMMFITQRGESQGKTTKERKATKIKDRGLEQSMDASDEPPRLSASTFFHLA